MNEKRYPLEMTQFKTEHYRPGDHFRTPQRWDNFTMHVPIWTQVLNHFFQKDDTLKFLELGSGNGLCANWLLDTFKNCIVDTVDIENVRIVEEDGTKYRVVTTENLKPFIDADRCYFYESTTKDFFNNGGSDITYDFAYVDASHDIDWVLYDGISAFNCLRVGGLLIFDDYGWGNTKVGIDAFLTCFADRFQLVYKDWQVMVMKTKNLE